MTTPVTAPVLDRDLAIQCRSLTKRFGANTVVRDVDLEVRVGEIHSLVGANGAGKSTLLGMISGRISSTSGEMEAFGTPIVSGKPRRSRAQGIATVYQELSIVPQLSAVANVFLGNERHRGGTLDEREMRRRFSELCEEFEVEIPPRALGRELSVATQQVLEIMRAVGSNARVMLFDEPTAALSQSERDNFLRVIRRLAARGVAIVLVSHNLGEVLSVSDTVTVLRGGRVIESAPGATWTRDRLVHAMTGDVVPVSVREEHPTLGDDLLELSGLEVPGVLSEVSLHVRRGEIVGLAGLVGAGRTTILRSLAGVEPRSRGELRIDGTGISWPRSVRDAMVRAGIGLVPEERKLEGVHLALSAPDNVTITDLGRYGRYGLVERRKQFAVAERLLTQMKLSRPVGDYPVADLSGGNQQKVAIAKWLARSPRVLLFDEPTRGIDVVAKVDVMSAIRAYARAGHAVIVTSSELEEVLDISDRLYVVSRGAIVGEFDMHTAPPTLNQVVQLSFARMG